MKAVRFFFCFVLILYFAVPPVIANDAVSVTNFKVDGLYGNFDGESGKAFAGTVTFPVGMSYGIQIDGLGGEVNPDEVYGVGAHAFWRDSNVGLLGLTGSSSAAYDYETQRVGIEGEYYVNRGTLSAYLGHQAGDVDTSGYAGFVAGYYVNDDLLCSAGLQQSDGFFICNIGTEYQTSMPGLTVYANLAMGEDDYEHVYFGLRYYFGAENKTLIRRHREDDPMNNIMTTLWTIFAIFQNPCICLPSHID